MRAAIAVALAMACGGAGPAAVDTPLLTPLVDALGRRCTISAPSECPVAVGLRAGTICANDRFGTTCTAYCVDQVCQDPGTICLDRVGAEGAGLPGFCWKRCATDPDCASDLHCLSGICGPR